MANLKEIHLSHLPPEISLFVAQFRDVKNASFLRDQLLAGNADFEYAFLDASMILSTTHVLSAAFRAVNDLLHHRLKSHNVHSETVFALSPNNNIAESFRRFGVTEKTRDLIVLKVSTNSSVTFDTVKQHLESAVEAVAIDFNDENIKAAQDLDRIKKVYKLSSFGKGPKKGRTQLPNDDLGDHSDPELEIAVLGSMAIRGAS